MDPICIKLPRLSAGNEYVPIVIGAVDEWMKRNDARGPRVVFPIEEQQIDSGSIP